MVLFVELVFSILFALLLAYAIWQYNQFKFGRVLGVKNGPWTTDLDVGRKGGKNFILKAWVAKRGLWALSSSEAVYFIAETDSEGRQLDYKCDYTIEGKELDAYWWSITAYKDYRFIPNDSDRYSYTTSNITRKEDGSWVIQASAQPRDGNWIPLGNGRGKIVICLRLYNPGDSVYRHPESVELPGIRRGNC